jgi:hypothetical protein
MTPAFRGSRVALGLVWAGATWTLAAFFLPWVHVEVRDPGVSRAVSQLLGRVRIEIEQPQGTIGADLSTLTALPAQLSGAQIPKFLVEERVQVALTVAAFWQQEVLRWRQYRDAVYAVPGLALLIALLLTLRPQPRWVPWLAAAALGTAAVWAAWRWRAWDRDTPALVLKLGVGLATSWGAYGLMMAGALMQTKQERP